MVKQKEIANYVRQAGDGLPFATRMRLKKNLQNSLSDFLDERSDRTINDVLEHFGSPDKFTDEYVLAMDTVDRQNILHKTKWFKRVVCIGGAVVITIIAIATIWVVNENSRMVGYYYYEETEKTE